MKINPRPFMTVILIGVFAEKCDSNTDFGINSLKNIEDVI